MIKYDLPMLGYDYRGVASSKKYYTYEGNGDDWRIIDIPKEVPIEDAKKFVNNFINGILALEIPSSLVCNLRCNYCYISDPRMKNIKVSPKQIIDILENASLLFPGLSKSEEIRKSVSKREETTVYISPWGAEPFANLDTLEAIYEFAHEYYGKNKYKIGTSTNGTILNDRRGLLLDPTGKTHIIREGELLGKNYGRVSSIKKDRIEIREITYDAHGGQKARKIKIDLEEE